MSKTGERLATAILLPETGSYYCAPRNAHLGSAGAFRFDEQQRLVLEPDELPALVLSSNTSGLRWDGLVLIMLGWCSADQRKWKLCLGQQKVL